MAHVYILDGTTFENLGILDGSYGSIQIVRRLWGYDTFQMRIHRKRLYANDIESGKILWFPHENNAAFLVETILDDQVGSSLNDWMQVSGRSLDGFATEERRIVPPAGQDYDHVASSPAETVMKHYVNDHAGPGADADRQVPGLTIEADAARGANVTYDARYLTITQALKEIGMVATLGWQAVFTYNAATPASSTFEFQIIEGVDRSAEVFFDYEYQTLEEWHELERILDSKTFAIVAGQGEGSARDIVERYIGGSAPTGFSRREAFVDARDVDLGNTTMLQQRGDAFLAGAAPERSLEAKEHQFGSFRYRTDWDLGDVVLVRNRSRGLSYAARIVEVSKTISDGPEQVTATMDRPFPTLKEKVTAASSAGTGSIIVDQPVGGTGGGGTNLDGGTPSETFGGTTGLDGGTP